MRAYLFHEIAYAVFILAILLLQINSFDKDYVSRSQRSEKLNLISQIAVHADYSVFLMYKQIFNLIDADGIRLGSIDDDYVVRFIEIIYICMVRSVSYIYESIKNPYFSIKLKLIDLHVQTRQPTSKYFKHIPWSNLSANIDANKYLSNMPSYFATYYRNSTLNIGIKTMMTSFLMGREYNDSKNASYSIKNFKNDTYIDYSIAGIAFMDSVCSHGGVNVCTDYDYMASVHLLSHETGHNLGIITFKVL